MPARVQRRTRRTVRDDDASVEVVVEDRVEAPGAVVEAHSWLEARRTRDESRTSPSRSMYRRMYRTTYRSPSRGRGDPTSRCSRGLTGADQSSDVILATALDRPGYWWPAALAAGKLARLRFTVVSVVEV